VGQRVIGAAAGLVSIVALVVKVAMTAGSIGACNDDTCYDGCDARPPCPNMNILEIGLRQGQCINSMTMECGDAFVPPFGEVCNPFGSYGGEEMTASDAFGGDWDGGPQTCVVRVRCGNQSLETFPVTWSRSANMPAYCPAPDPTFVSVCDASP
jgi:hypothetical protein